MYSMKAFMLESHRKKIKKNKQINNKHLNNEKKHCKCVNVNQTAMTEIAYDYMKIT